MISRVASRILRSSCGALERENQAIRVVVSVFQAFWNVTNLLLNSVCEERFMKARFTAVSPQFVFFVQEFNGSVLAPSNSAVALRRSCHLAY